MSGRILKWVASYLVVLLIAVTILPVSGLAAVTDQWSETIAPKTTEDVNKTWNVTFSDDIDPTSLNEGNVRVMAQDRTAVPVQTRVTGRILHVVPVGAYLPGTYTLYIGPGITSVKGKEQKANIKFTFTVIPAADEDQQVIQSVTEKGVMIGNKLYTPSSELGAFFGIRNAAALKNAEIRFQSVNGQITTIEELHLRNTGSQSEPYVLEGNQINLRGDLYIEGDYNQVNALNVTGSLYITDQVKEHVVVKESTISGDAIVKPANGERSMLLTASHLSATRLTIVFNDSSVATLEINKENVYIQGIGNTTVASIQANANASLYFTSDIIIPQVRISGYTTEVELNGTMQSVSIESTENVKLTGSGNFETIRILADRAVDMSLKGIVKTLDAKMTAGTVTLANTIQVSDVKLPAGKTIDKVIDNYEEVKENVEKVNGQKNPDNGAGELPGTPEDHFAAGVSFVQNRYGYVSINVKNQGADRVKYLQVNRFAVPDGLSKGRIGEVVPKAAAEFQSGHQIPQYYGHDLYVYLVDRNDVIKDMKIIDQSVSYGPLVELNGNMLTVTLPTVSENLTSYTGNSHIYVATEDFSQSFLDLGSDRWATTDGLLTAQFELKEIPKGTVRVIVDASITKSYKNLNEEAGNGLSDKLLLSELYMYLHLGNEASANFFLFDPFDALACDAYHHSGSSAGLCDDDKVKTYERDSLSVSTYKNQLLAQEATMKTGTQFRELITSINQQLKPKVDVFKKADKLVSSLFKDNYYQHEEGNRVRPETTQQDILTAKQAVDAVSEDYWEKNYMYHKIEAAQKELDAR